MNRKTVRALHLMTEVICHYQVVRKVATYAEINSDLVNITLHVIDTGNCNMNKNATDIKLLGNSLAYLL